MSYFTFLDRHRLLRLLQIASIALLLLVAGCASDGGDETAGESDTTDSTTATTSDDTSSTETTAPDSDETAVLPSFVWAVEDGSYDLVRVATDTGEIVQRIEGWGEDAADPNREGGAQVLQQLSATDDLLWVGDCCEPAVGNIFLVDPTASTPVPDSAVRAFGTEPLLSPDGSRLAVSMADFGVAVLDARTGDELVSADVLGAAVTPPSGMEAPTFATAVAWIDDDTIAVAVNGDGVATVTMVSVAVESDPSAVGPLIEIEGRIIDGATRADGALVLAVEPAGSTDIGGQVFSPDSGEEDAAFDLDDAAIAIDYDATGTFLLVARESLPPTWQGLGESGEIGDTALHFAVWAESDAFADTGDPAGEDDQADETDDSDDAGGTDDGNAAGEGGDDQQGAGDGTDPEPAPVVTIDSFTTRDVSDSGLEGIGCYFHPGDLDQLPVFHASLEGKYMEINGEPTVFELDQRFDISTPVSNDDYVITFTNIGEREPSSIESTVQPATLVLTPTDSSVDPVTVEGVMWCGV